MEKQENYIKQIDILVNLLKDRYKDSELVVLELVKGYIKYLYTDDKIFKELKDLIRHYKYEENQGYFLDIISNRIEQFKNSPNLSYKAYENVKDNPDRYTIYSEYLEKLNK